MGPELCCSGRYVRGGEGSTTCWPSWCWPSSCDLPGLPPGAARVLEGREVRRQHRLPCHCTQVGVYRLAPAVAFPAASLGPMALQGTVQPQPWQASLLLAAVLTGQQSSRVTGRPCSLQAILQTAEDLFHLVQWSQETATLLQQELMQGSGLGPRLSMWEMASASCPCVCRSCCSPRGCLLADQGLAGLPGVLGTEEMGERGAALGYQQLLLQALDRSGGGWLCWAAEVLDACLDL